MTKQEFNEGKFTQIRRSNIPNSKVYNVCGKVGIEELVIINDPHYDGEKYSYIRYENAEIITKYPTTPVNPATMVITESKQKINNGNI